MERYRPHAPSCSRKCYFNWELLSDCISIFLSSFFLLLLFVLCVDSSRLHLAFSASTTSGQRSGTSQTSDDDGAERCYRGKYRWRALTCFFLFLLLLFSIVSEEFLLSYSYFLIGSMCLEALSIISSAERKGRALFPFLLSIPSGSHCHCLPLSRNRFISVPFFVFPFSSRRLLTYKNVAPFLSFWVRNRGGPRVHPYATDETV